jgi:hypothetical protein
MSCAERLRFESDLSCVERVCLCGCERIHIQSLKRGSKSPLRYLERVQSFGSRLRDTDEKKMGGTTDGKREYGTEGGSKTDKMGAKRRSVGVLVNERWSELAN